ncbi:MAG TPA: hypothetical protein PLG47_00910 [Candidatus Dojkabacteria bacterium]|nr:hypothetical protein [Candidatus Dojkabacteria bacterium]
MEPKEGIEKNNNLNYSQKEQLNFFAALSSVTAIPQGVNAKDRYQEPIPIIQPLRHYGPNRSSVREDAPVLTNAPIYICQDPLAELIIEDCEIENTNLSKFEFPLLSGYSLLSIVGFVEMMEELYPELNMVDISSISTEKGAQSLVPSSLYSNYYRESPLKVPLYNGEVGIGGYAIAIDEYKRGDIFVISGGDFGHMGLVLGKYEVNGQKLLLLADSNKLIDINVYGAKY